MHKNMPTVGFISPPGWYDPAPSEFPTVCKEAVRTQQMPLPLPDLDWRLESVANAGEALALSSRLLGQSGCDVIAQDGTPFAWAGVGSEEAARERCRALARAAGVPAHMTALAVVDVLRALGANSLALAATYYPPDWRDAWAHFVGLCGFDTVYVANLTDQGLATASDLMSEYGWSMTPELARAAILRAAKDAPTADAIVVTGIGARTLALLNEVESVAQRPVVGADTALYWAIIRELGLTPRRQLGRMADAR